MPRGSQYVAAHPSVFDTRCPVAWPWADGQKMWPNKKKDTKSQAVVAVCSFGCPTSQCMVPTRVSFERSIASFSRVACRPFRVVVLSSIYFVHLP